MAKKIVTKVIDGLCEYLAMIWDYENQIKRVMPDTIVVIELEDIEPEQGICEFRRIYTCFGSVKKGYIAGCMPIVRLDVCHL